MTQPWYRVMACKGTPSTQFVAVCAKDVDADLGLLAGQALRRHEAGKGSNQLRNCFTLPWSTSVASMKRYGPAVIEAFGCFFTTI